MNIKKIILFSLLCVMAALKSSASNDTWYIIGDGKALMPLASVRCLVGSDVTGLITVVGTDIQVADINEVTFAADPKGAIDSPIVSAGSVTLINNILSIKYAFPGATVTIHSIDGCLLYSDPLSADSAEIDISHFIPGVYLVTIGGDSTFKLMKR